MVADEPKTLLLWTCCQRYNVPEGAAREFGPGDWITCDLCRESLT